MLTYCCLRSAPLIHRSVCTSSVASFIRRTPLPELEYGVLMISGQFCCLTNRQISLISEKNCGIVSPSVIALNRLRQSAAVRRPVRTVRASFHCGMDSVGMRVRSVSKRRMICGDHPQGAASRLSDAVFKVDDDRETGVMSGRRAGMIEEMKSVATAASSTKT